MRREDPLGQTLHGAGGQRQETLPHARRRSRIGGAVRKPERVEEWGVHPRGDRRAPRVARSDAFGTAARAEDRVTVATGKPLLSQRYPH
jgi:hypothetical protein